MKIQDIKEIHSNARVKVYCAGLKFPSIVRVIHSYTKEQVKKYPSIYSFELETGDRILKEIPRDHKVYFGPKFIYN